MVRKQRRFSGNKRRAAAVSCANGAHNALFGNAYFPS
jgi:hypothetical protein